MHRQTDRHRETDIERQTLTDDIYRQTDAQTYTHTLDKKWIIEVIRWELNPLTCNWIRNTDLKKISSKWYTMNMKKLSEKRKTDGTYVILASQNDFTLLNRRLRWPESCWEASGPLQEGKNKEKRRGFTSIQMFEGSLEVKLPTIWTDEKQSRAEAERRGRLEERRSEEKE